MILYPATVNSLCVFATLTGREVMECLVETATFAGPLARLPRWRVTITRPPRARVVTPAWAAAVQMEEEES